MTTSNTPAQNAALSSTNFSWRWWLKDLQEVKKNGKTVFSCFSCGGGSSMGYKLAGFEVVGNCEIDPKMAAVYEKNLHPRHSFVMDIRDFINEQVPEDLQDLDVLDGSPPCSVFSMAGKREEAWGIEKKFREQKEQRLDDLFLHLLAVAKKLQPKTIVAENVTGIVRGNSKGWVNQIVKAFDDAGYSLQIFQLDASRMGVPQARERVFFIGHRKDMEWPKLRLAFNDPLVTFGEVRSPKGEPAGELATELLKLRLPTDHKLFDISKRVRKKLVGYTSSINWDNRPAFTIVAGGVMYRGYDGMALSKQDIVNCQTFPQDYDFGGQSVQYICGMSVPPVMMAKISEQIYNQWLKK